MPGPRSPEFTHEFRLLLAGALYPLKGSEVEKLRACCSTTIDWPAFFALVERHRLTPTVYRNLSSNVADSVPEPILARLKGRAEHHRKRILQIMAESSQISQWFALEEIKTCSLKGPLLAHRLFGDISLRTSRDLDLLIPLESLAQADALLLAHGCQRTLPAAPLTPRQWEVYQQEWVHYTYVLPKRRIYLELHWTIGSPYLIAMEVSRQMLASAHPVVLSGNTFYTLADDDMAIYLLIHGTRHNWVRLKWLVDFATWMRRAADQDWQALIRTMEGLDLQRSLAQGVLLANRLFAIPIPEPVQTLVTSDAINQKLAGHSVHALLNADYTGAEVGQLQRLGHVRYTMKLKKGWRYQWAAFSKLWTSPEDWQDLRLPDTLFPLYPLLRPFLWLWRNHLRPRG